MLTNISLRNNNEITEHFSTIIGNILNSVQDPVILETGIYSSQAFCIPEYCKNIIIHKSLQLYNSRDSYGICDNYQQILEQYPEIEDVGRDFVVELVEVNKLDQLSIGGWKWSNWGTYIGTQNPQAKYLYDESTITQVYCFRIYEV